MMCLADRVESLQGDPSVPLSNTSIRSVVSYGNRLFSDYRQGQARHRWGSSTLYRGFYEDYQTFLARPEWVAERIDANDRRIFVVQSDLRQFYDRVTPSLLKRRIFALRADRDDHAFFDIATNFLIWSWAHTDLNEVQIYAQQAKLPDFSRVVLPQGFVSAGFFANVALLSFDAELKSQVDHDIAPGITLHDASRYVDDLRIVVSGPRSTKLEEVEVIVFDWISGLLERTANGLTPSKEKTQASAFRADERPLVQQSKRMARIQAAISGGFDPIGGGEILDSILALVRAQERLMKSDDTANPFTPIPDVRDATVDRFAAGRFRKTYRSLRPLLWDTEEVQNRAGEDDELSKFRGVRTRKDLDDETRAFALDLVAKWVGDPSNVRLLRIALDLWPAADVLEKILGLLRPFTEKGGRRKAPRRVAWYCLSEILRAGATETGFVDDSEQLPSAVNLDAYRSVLRFEANRIINSSGIYLPWYLKQQAYLFLSTNPPTDLRSIRPGKKSPLQPYRELTRFLLGEFGGLNTNDFATYAILSRRSYLNSAKAVELASLAMTPSRLNRIASLDPNFATEIIALRPEQAADLSPRNAADLGHGSSSIGGNPTLAALGLTSVTREILRNERSLLSFASGFLKAISAAPDVTTLSPSEVTLRLDEQGNGPREVVEIFLHPKNLAGNSLYEPPAWISSGDRWRFQLGFLLRFILTAHADFTKPVRMDSWREEQDIYRSPGSHWHQRIFGFFNGFAAFGDDWLPISDWTEKLLFGLLWWPGCADIFRARHIVGTLEETMSALEERLKLLRELQGTSATLLPLKLPRAFVGSVDRPLRACVVQTVFPTDTDFQLDDLEMSSPGNRTKHRRHLSTALATVERALALRETHMGRDGRLDWLILPELAVHPDDVWTHLVPFARAHRAVILAGLTYQQLVAGELLVNSALWILPTQDAHRGLQILVRRQGKQNLAPAEKDLNQTKERIQSFRPCQWLIGYQWSSDENIDPLWLSAAICFDATDIRLAADLKNRSDIFVVPALNKDVTTFDHMALALHYHMFQMVVVANNGRYGGSNAYAPYGDAWNRQIFHMHGQPQASIAFFELDHIADFKNRKSGTPGKYKFKPVPAGK